MISTVLLVVHIIFVAAMIGLILLQKSEGGALGMGGGNFMSARGTANLLTRSTAVLATLFFVSTLVLAISFRGSKSSDSITSAIEKAEQTSGVVNGNNSDPRTTNDEESSEKPSLDSSASKSTDSSEMNTSENVAAKESETLRQDDASKPKSESAAKSEQTN